MSKEQIEEMAQDICKIGKPCEKCSAYPYACKAVKYAERFYNAGYCKQSEGEWKKLYDKAPRYVCTICNHLFNNKEYKYCPNCGAKMKG